MIKFGLEKEFFLVNPNTNEVLLPVSVNTNLPLDSCGYLVEARSKAYSDICESTYSLLADIYRIGNMLKNTTSKLSDEPVRKLSRDFLTKVSRYYSKGLAKYNNYFGFTNHRITLNERTAGLHLSITDEHTYVGKHGVIGTYYKNFDYMSIFRTLDEKFSDEIKASKRNKGFYEVKEDGRIEYRSLPANIGLNKLIEVIDSLKL